MTTDVHPYDIPPREKWPAGLREVADVIGDDLALELGAAYGGVPVYIPRKPTAGHAFGPLLPPPALDALCASHLGGGWLTIPGGPARHTRQRDIRRLLAQGMSLRQVALRMKVSLWYVGYVRRKMRTEGGVKQLSLPGFG